MLVQTADAFWINNSCLALNKLNDFCILMSEGDSLQHCLENAPPSLFYPFFYMNILVQFEDSLFHVNVLYTFVLLMDMIAFLVLNMGELECHQCRCMYM